MFYFDSYQKGSLFALGLIYANNGHGQTTSYLLQQLANVDAGLTEDANPVPGTLDLPQKKEIVQHGACLGLGVASMASGNEEVFTKLMEMLYQNDSAVAGV